MTDERILQKIAEALLAAGLGRMMVLVMVNVILPIGAVQGAIGAHRDRRPLVFWVAIAPGIDPIHPGIVLVVNMEIGIITPPVGLNLFVILITCVPGCRRLPWDPGS
ncbi:MAG: TRAP transporter large permease subunit [Rhodobacteraceae bacterium]|nr:TRAP transporter large permease subunit [Paracoccaceae bacterium]